MNPNTYQALAFLSGAASDDQGRMVSDYLAFSPEKWEECHNHIQWAFPSSIPSEFNPGAPVIDYKAMVGALYDSSERELRDGPAETVMNNLVALTHRYLESIGITIDAQSGQCVVDVNHAIWQGPDHNHRRLTRLILLWENLDDILWNVYKDFDSSWRGITNQLLTLVEDKIADPYWSNVSTFWFKAHNYGTI